LEIQAVFYFFLVIAAFLALMYITNMFFIRRANIKLVKAFREKGALEPQHAVSKAELGIKPQGIMDRLIKPRDFRPLALDFLLQTGVVKIIEDGESMYLSEDRLSSLKGEEGTRVARFVLPPWL